MEADAVRLLQAARRGQSAVAADRKRDDDDKAFRALAKDGAVLRDALSDVLLDNDFWSRLRTAAEGQVLLPPEERDALEALLDAELAAVLEALGHKPPPPVVELVDWTLLAVARALETQLSPGARVQRIVDLQFELGMFVKHLNLLVAPRGPVPVSRKRRRLRNAVSRGSRTAVALAIAAAGIGAEAGFGALGAGAAAAQLGGKAGELVAQAMAERAREELADPARVDAETAAQLDEIDPAARVKTFARLLESRIARAAEYEADLQEILDAAEGDLARLERATRRGARSAALDASVREVQWHLSAARNAFDAKALDRMRDSLFEALKAAERTRVLADPPGLEAGE